MDFYTPCENTPLGTNCKVNHGLSFLKCPVYIHEQKIQKFCTIHQLSRMNAKKLLWEEQRSSSQTYAMFVHQNPVFGTRTPTQPGPTRESTFSRSTLPVPTLYPTQIRPTSCPPTSPVLSSDPPKRPLSSSINPPANFPFHTTYLPSLSRHTASMTVDLHIVDPSTTSHSVKKAIISQSRKRFACDSPNKDYPLITAALTVVLGTSQEHRKDDTATSVETIAHQTSKAQLSTSHDFPQPAW